MATISCLPRTTPLHTRRQIPRMPTFPILVFVVASLIISACSSSVRFASTRTGIGSGSTAQHERPEAPVSRSNSSAANSPRSKEPSAFEATETLFSGIASYYGNEFHGRKTANGERYDKHDLSAAHRTLPFGTMVRVRNVANDRSVVVRINDRGPWKETRVMDVSFAAAEALEMTRSGTAQVEVTVLR